MSNSLSRASWKQFRRNRPAMAALWFLSVMLLLALMAPLLANDRPLYARYHDKHIFPALYPNKTYIFVLSDGSDEYVKSALVNWKTLPLEKAVWAPVAWWPGESDYANAHFVSPGGSQQFRDASGVLTEMPQKFRHRLGTNNTGEDVAAGLIHGARVSLSIGMIAMGIAACIGLLLGAIAGYFGDKGIRMTRGQWFTLVPGLFIAWFYGFSVRHFTLTDALQAGGWKAVSSVSLSLIIFIAILMVCWWLGKLLSRIPFFQKGSWLPADNLISRTIEIIHSLPVFMLIITIAAITKPSIVSVMILLGLTSWTGIARLTRAEFLRIRELDYMQAGRSLGLGAARLIWRHALPNALAPALVSIAFGVASAILAESALSFLGVGVPTDLVTWGSLVNEGRQQYSAWWLVVFPGLFIFGTVTAYNLIGDGLRDAMDPKLRKQIRI